MNTQNTILEVSRIYQPKNDKFSKYYQIVKMNENFVFYTLSDENGIFDENDFTFYITHDKFEDMVIN